MARTQKDTVNYFPHEANASAGDTLTVLQSRFGNDGYAFWFKLLEKLASTEGHYLDCRNSTRWQLLLAKAGINEITGVEIMNLLVEMQAIDAELWKSKLIWCQKLVDNIAVVYSSRHREPPKRPIITEINAITTGRNCITCGKRIEHMRSDAKYCSDSCRQKANRVTDSRDTKTDQNGITTQGNPITTETNGLTMPDNPQSRESKVKKSKVDNKENNKRKYGEFQNVLLTEEEYKKLKDNLGAEVERFIETLSGYLESHKRKHYDSHYATILNWSRRDKEQGGKAKNTRELPKIYAKSPDYDDL